MAYGSPIFSSANPAVDALFGREFGAYQEAERARQQAAQNALLGQQIQAQSALAQAQLRGQQQQQATADLFRMQQGKQVDRQLDIDEKYKAGLTSKPNLRSAQDIEEANAASDAIASQLNGSYQTKLNAARMDLNKRMNDELKAASTLGVFPATNAHLKEISDKYDQQLKALDDTILSQTQDIGTRYYPPGSFGVDPINRKFIPVRIGGAKAVTPPGPTPPDPNVAIGPAVKDSGSVSPVPFTMTQPAAQPTATAFGNPFSGIAGLFGARSGAAPEVSNMPVRIPVQGGGTLEMPSDVAAETERQLRLIAPEQRAAAAGAIRDQLLKSGRARIIAAPVELGQPYRVDIQ